MPSATNNGIVHVPSPHSVGESVERLLAILKTKGIHLFAVVDHSGEAAKAGLAMRDTKLIIFGNPKAGTPLMIAAPDSALDLPLKILIAEQPDGSTRLSYNSVDFLLTRHGLVPEFAANLAAIEQIAAAVASGSIL
jgi:uncharacterized protein (DUF302 family)